MNKSLEILIRIIHLQSFNFEGKILFLINYADVA